MEGKLHIMMVISMMLPFAKLAFAIPDTFTLGVSRLFLFFGGGGFIWIIPLFQDRTNASTSLPLSLSQNYLFPLPTSNDDDDVIKNQYGCTVSNNKTSMGQTLRSQHYRLSQGLPQRYIAHSQSGL